MTRWPHMSLKYDAGCFCSCHFHAGCCSAMLMNGLAKITSGECSTRWQRCIIPDVGEDVRRLHEGFTAV
jgi:hypothetical protein